MSDLISRSEEIWKPIPEYEGIYEVSNLGNVRSVDRYLDCKIKKCEQASMERKNYISTEKERWKINSSIILSLKKEKNVGA